MILFVYLNSENINSLNFFNFKMKTRRLNNLAQTGRLSPSNNGQGNIS